jgi:hypothetical protein
MSVYYGKANFRSINSPLEDEACAALEGLKHALDSIIQIILKR